MFKRSFKSKVSVALAVVLLVLVSGALSGSSSSSNRWVNLYLNYNCYNLHASIPYHISQDYRYYCAIRDGNGNRVKSWMIVVRSDLSSECLSVDNDTRPGQCNNCPATED